MDVQLVSSGLEIDVAERPELADLHLGEVDENATIACEAFEVGMALLVQIRAHLLYLKVGHVTYSPAQGAFMSPRAAELKTFEQSSRRQHLAGSAYDFGKADVTGKNTDNVGASCNPDDRFVFIGI